MGSWFSSNEKEFHTNPKLVVKNTVKLQRLLLRHRNNAAIMPILEQVPYACNFSFDPISRECETTFLNNFYGCAYPLYFHIATLRFDDDCEIALTKRHYHQIVAMTRAKTITSLSKDDQIRMLEWTVGYNWFCQ